MIYKNIQNVRRSIFLLYITPHPIKEDKMYNSNNSAVGKVIFTGTQLAQAKLLGTREQFLLDRKKGIGGSDVASILGVSPYSTALEVYHDKTKPELVLDEPTEDMQRGVRV